MFLQLFIGANIIFKTLFLVNLLCCTRIASRSDVFIHWSSSYNSCFYLLQRKLTLIMLWIVCLQSSNTWRLVIVEFFSYPFQPSVTFHIETSHLICRANQITSFYMKCNTGLTRVKHMFSKYSSNHQDEGMLQCLPLSAIGKFITYSLWLHHCFAMIYAIPLLLIRYPLVTFMRCNKCGRKN